MKPNTIVECTTELRKIAKMMAHAISQTDSQFEDNVALILTELRKTKRECRLALKQAYIFSRKCPAQEREDLFQELFLKLWEGKPKDEKLAYSVARCDWKNWWRHYRYRSHFSLDAPLPNQNDDGTDATLRETLAGEIEFEAKMCLHLDCMDVYNKLPDWAKSIVERQVWGIDRQGKVTAVKHPERMMLDRWIKANMSVLIG